MNAIKNKKTQWLLTGLCAFSISMIGCDTGGGGGDNVNPAGNGGGITAVAPTSLNQALFQVGTQNYIYAFPPSIPNIQISGAPADTDGKRWEMLHDGTTYRLYFFKFGTTDTLYQFGFNPVTSKYEYGYNSIPEIKIIGTGGAAIPADVDSSSFSMLYDKGTTSPTYRLYMRSKSDPKKLHQFSWNGTKYEYGHNSIPVLKLTGGPADTDYSRWAMLHDGADYRYYAFQAGSATVFYQFAFNPASQDYEYGYNSISTLNIVGMPANSNTSSFAMLYSGTYYHFYFQTK